MFPTLPPSCLPACPQFDLPPPVQVDDSILTQSRAEGTRDGSTALVVVRLGASRCSIDEPPSAAAAGHGGRNGNGATATATALKAQQIVTYPLYPKGADPMKLQHAVLLLGRNVQQLLLALGELPPQPPRNILPALHLLVQRIAAEWPLPLPPSANSYGITALDERTMERTLLMID